MVASRQDRTPREEGAESDGSSRKNGETAEPPKGDFEAARLFCCQKRPHKRKGDCG
jgi:hypothetical protein